MCSSDLEHAIDKHDLQVRKVSLADAIEELVENDISAGNHSCASGIARSAVGDASAQELVKLRAEREALRTALSGSQAPSPETRFKRKGERKTHQRRPPVLPSQKVHKQTVVEAAQLDGETATMPTRGFPPLGVAQAMAKADALGAELSSARRFVKAATHLIAGAPATAASAVLPCESITVAEAPAAHPAIHPARHVPQQQLSKAVADDPALFVLSETASMEEIVAKRVRL